MIHKPWHFTGIFVVAVFVASMFFGYYSCKNNEMCTAPFAGNFDELSQEEIQSKLLISKERRELIKKRRDERLKNQDTILSEFTISKKPEEKSETGNDFYYEKIPSNWNPSNIIIASGGGEEVRKKDVELVQQALAPFREMVPNIKLIIYIHYNMDALGKGIRGYTSSYGKVMNIIAPDSYSYRYITDREYVAILRHEMGHVIHDQILTYADRKNWEKLVLADGKVKADSQFSKYAGYDEYEALSETMIGLLFTDAEVTAEQKKLLKNIYDFFEKHFQITNFEDQRDSYTWKNSNMPKDATRVFDDYPLPQFTL